MATLSEELVGIKCKIESVYHDETAAIEAQTCADDEKTGQQMEMEVKQESQNEDENRLQSEAETEGRKVFIKCEIHPDSSSIYTNETEEENSENSDHSEYTADVNTNIENSVSEVHIESESIFVVEDNFLKIKKACEDVCEVNTAGEVNEDPLIDYDGDESSLPESVNNNNDEESVVCDTVANIVNQTVEENTSFDWEKLFTPAPTNFSYPQDEKEIEKLAAALWERKYKLSGRNLHDVITMCNFASQWKTISEESKNYVFQRMSLLYLAVTRGWRYALAASDQDNQRGEKRPAIENSRGGFRPRKRRRMT